MPKGIRGKKRENVNNSASLRRSQRAVFFLGFLGGFFDIVKDIDEWCASSWCTCKALGSVCGCVPHLRHHVGGFRSAADQLLMLTTHAGQLCLISAVKKM